MAGVLRKLLVWWREVHARARPRPFVTELRLLGFGRRGRVIVRIPRVRPLRAGRMMLDWLHATLSQSAPTAYNAAQRYADAAPGPLATVAVAYEALRSKRPHEALRMLARLDLDDAELAHWLPYWDVLTAAMHGLGHYEDELAAAHVARARHPGDARPGIWQARALVALGHVREAQRQVESSSSPQALLGLGEELRTHGHSEAARGVFRRVIACQRARPVRHRTDALQQHLVGDALLEIGEYGEARGVFEALAAADASSPAWVGHLGVIVALQGRDGDARGYGWRLATMAHPYLLGTHTLFRARIAALLGERDRAVVWLGEAFEQGVSWGPWLHRDLAFTALRGYGPFEDIVTPHG